MEIFQKFTAALMSVFTLLSAAITAGNTSIDENIAYQNAHMEYLVNDYYKNYTPCDENKIASFDIPQAIEQGVKFNEVVFLGTHNSYQLRSTQEYSALYSALSDLTFGILDETATSFEMDTLTEQLQLGIRSLELDIETVVSDDEVGFVVSHAPILDITSNCYDLEKALEEIKMWSDANPDHLPVTVIIEPKTSVPIFNGMRNFSLGYANVLDEVLREKLGDTLLTPSDMMGDYENFKTMREDDGWLPLEETLGKVLVLLHDTTVTDKYIAQDVSIRTQAMFPMLRYQNRNETYASFIIDNEPSDAIRHYEESVEKCRLIVRTRADSFPSFSDSEYEKANICGSQIISTDYPVRANGTENHVYSFDGYTVKLNNN